MGNINGGCFLTNKNGGWCDDEEDRIWPNVHGKEDTDIKEKEGNEEAGVEKPRGAAQPENNNNQVEDPCSHHESISSMNSKSSSRIKSITWTGDIESRVESVGVTDKETTENATSPPSA